MFWSFLIIVIGLSLFETVSSIDNAVINAEVLATMSPRAKRWFLTWGMLSSVFIIRGLLPFLIVWIFNTKLNALQILSASWSSNPLVLNSVQQSAPVLLITGGIFLIFLFLHWLFLEEKKFGLPHTEKFFMSKGVYFYATIFLLFFLLTYFSFKENIFMCLGLVVGALLFFITQFLKQKAERGEKKLLKSTSNGLNKILFLEIIDSTFSIDGVLGAFAFTLSIPLILIGSGLGAIVVRQLTVNNIERIRKYVYLKNGAMYSILVLGVIMILHSFGFQIPEYVSPLSTCIIIGFFFWKSTLVLQ